MPPFELSVASPADSAAIASLFSLSWTSPFTRLQFGAFDTSSLAKAMTPRIAENMKKPQSCFITMRDQESSKVISVAQWAIPAEDGPEEPSKTETAEEAEERQEMEDEAYRKRLAENSNEDLIMEFTLQLREMRNECLGGQRHYCQGLASTLIQWPFAEADEKGILVYLDTSLDNLALSLYKKLGFKDVSRSCIDDLTKYGGEGSHTHVSLIRYPKLSATL